MHGTTASAHYGRNDAPSATERTRQGKAYEYAQGKRGSASQKEIAEKLDIRPQSLSELLVKMESDGFISRRQDKDDKRVIVVALTEKGEEQLVVLRQANREHAEKLFSPLTEEEKDALIAILKKLTQKEDK